MAGYDEGKLRGRSMRVTLLVLVLLLFFGFSHQAYAQGLIEILRSALRPSKDFANIDVNSTLGDAKKLGLACRGGSDIHNGKTHKFSTCEDEKYQSTIFGFDVQFRAANFIDGKLVSIQAHGKALLSPEDEYKSLKIKLDSAYKRIDNPGFRESKSDYWDFGDGYILISGPPLHVVDSIETMKRHWRIAFVLATPAANIFKQKP